VQKIVAAEKKASDAAQANADKLAKIQRRQGRARRWQTQRE
jgi:hypothetical protein